MDVPATKDITPELSGGAGRLKAKTLAIAFGANLLGGMLFFLYVAVIDVSSLSDMQLLRSWQALAFSLAPSLVCVALAWNYSRSVFEYLGVVSRPGFEPLAEEDGGGRIIHLRRRALRFPLYCSLASLAGWIVMGLLIALRVWITGRSFMLGEPIALEAETGGATALLSEELFQSGAMLKYYWTYLVQSVKGVGLSVLIGGMVSASLFFVIESIWQRELPAFFPETRLTGVKDSWLIMLAILSYQRAATMFFSQPENVLSHLLVINLVTVAIGVVLAVSLAVYVARSVSEPLVTLRRAFERVGAGDLEVRAPARANDELGLLSEGFNAMVKSLAGQDASIRELTHGLEEKVEERTRELQEALEEKERTQAQLVHSEKMASLGLLVAGVAHEINNPIGYIYANADLLKRFLAKLHYAAEHGDMKSFEQNADKMEQVLKSTQDGAKRAKEIVQGLKRFSRKDSSARSPTDVREAVDTALMLLSHELKDNVELELDFDEVPAVTANSGELSQVFINIIANALQAMEGSGKLDIKVKSEDGKVIVEFTDTGGGISDDDMAHIFEPFFTTKDVGDGTGLGLSIAYGIVKAHEGEIEFESAPGRGTTARVTLPANR